MFRWKSQLRPDPTGWIWRSSIKVLFCSSEVAPFAKTGGLADVAGSLPLALGKLGIEVLVMMPRYRGIEGSEKKISDRVRVRFVEHEAFFNRSGLYGNGDSEYSDNLDRFNFFSYECLHQAKRLGFKPDIVHAHDWHTALIPVLLKAKFWNDKFFKKTRSVLTIHNIAYQGHFAATEYYKLGLPPALFSVDVFEFYGKLNVLKAGALYADRVNTVSPSYAKEILTGDFAFGMEGVLQKRKKFLSGILNGIDTQLWDPATDTRIAAVYSASSLKGKARCKAMLQKQYGFRVDPSVPMFAMVSRFAEQKGLDPLAASLPEILSRKLQLVILGDGESRYRQAFSEAERRYRGNMRAHIGFDAASAHMIYAGADFFLMPSFFEPCGLGQMIGMRYGTVPVVRATGGLKDTVRDADGSPTKGNGFVYIGCEGRDLVGAVDRAMRAYQNKARMKKIVTRAMKEDFSWDKSARKYKALYLEALS